MKNSEELLYIIRRQLSKLSTDELVKYRNGRLDMGDMGYTIYKMDEFDDVCIRNNIGATELLEDLGSQHQFNLSHKYFTFYDGTSCASDLISFDDYYDVYDKDTELDSMADDLMASLVSVENMVDEFIELISKGKY